MPEGIPRVSIPDVTSALNGTPSGATSEPGVMDFSQATADDATAIASLRNDVAIHLVLQYGKGDWASRSTERGVLYDMRRARVYVLRLDGDIVATLNLSTTKPWAIDRRYFTKCTKPIYLTSMAVDPAHQRQGIGMHCLKATQRIVREWPADAIRLDAYDADAGAGDFYRRSGYREVGRATFRGAPLIYFEWLATGKAASE